MTTAPTAEIDATLQQITELTAGSCDIVGVAVPPAGGASAAEVPVTHLLACWPTMVITLLRKSAPPWKPSLSRCPPSFALPRRQMLPRQN